MASKVVCISRAPGSGGDEIGHAVAQKLGFRLIDNEIIDRAAELAGVTEKEVERVENRQPLIQRFLERLAGSATDPVMGAPVTTTPPALLNERYQQFIVEVIRQTAEQGQCVILAHAASIPLAGMDGLLRVLVTGSPEARAERLAAANGVAHAQAEKLVKDGDRAREDYFRRFYQLREELPTHYDLVLNTDYMSLERATAVVLAAATA